MVPVFPIPPLLILFFFYEKWHHKANRFVKNRPDTVGNNKGWECRMARKTSNLLFLKMGRLFSYPLLTKGYFPEGEIWGLFKTAMGTGTV